MTRDAAIRLRNAVLCAIAVAVAGLASYAWSVRHGIRELHSVAEVRLAAATTALFAPTDKYSYLPELLATHPAVLAIFGGDRNAGALQQTNLFLERLNRQAKSAVIYLLDTRGLVIASSNWNEPQSFIGQNYAFRPYFKDAMAGGNGSFYGMGTTSLMPGYYLSAPVRRDGGTVGVAVVKVDMSSLDRSWIGLDADIFVTDENGVAFLSSRSDWKYRPIQPLSDSARDRLSSSRQYEGVLKPPLPLALVRELDGGSGNERLVTVTEALPGGRGQRDRPYFLKARMLDGAQWTVNVLIPMDATEAHARRIGAMTAGALALLALSILYLMQFRHRSLERERSRRELEHAHRALEEKHAELQQLSEELRLAAITDPLTGAYNRRFFLESMPRIVSAARRHHFPLSVIAIDIDHFKRINDGYGHATGDRVLLVLTEACKESLRQADIFARFGGEEFFMALPNTLPEVAVQVAERLREKISGLTVDTPHGPLAISISGGVSQYREEEADLEETLRRADEALYEAKAAGRNRIMRR